jgi:vitamin B12 transporter
VFIRGASSSHTLVLVDGINIADASSPSGAVDFSSLTLDNVERIEVVRGPQSTLYGANAIGGVINVITRKGGGKPRATVSMQAGNNSSNRQQFAGWRRALRLFDQRHPLENPRRLGDTR